jgi:hypothetical protein
MDNVARERAAHDAHDAYDTVQDDARKSVPDVAREPAQDDAHRAKTRENRLKRGMDNVAREQAAHDALDAYDTVQDDARKAIGFRGMA